MIKLHRNMFRVGTRCYWYGVVIRFRGRVYVIGR